MCTYIYVCMNECMYVCMYVWMDGWMDGCMYVCMYVYMYVCMHACTAGILLFRVHTGILCCLKPNLNLLMTRRLAVTRSEYLCLNNSGLGNGKSHKNRIPCRRNAVGDFSRPSSHLPSLLTHSQSEARHHEMTGEDLMPLYQKMRAEKKAQAARRRA